MKRSKRLRRRATTMSDRQLRMKIFMRYADSDMKIEAHLKAMQAIFDWLKGPDTPVAKKKATLILVSSKP